MNLNMRKIKIFFHCSNYCTHSEVVECRGVDLTWVAAIIGSLELLKRATGRIRFQCEPQMDLWRLASVSTIIQRSGLLGVDGRLRTMRSYRTPLLYGGGPIGESHRRLICVQVSSSPANGPTLIPPKCERAPSWGPTR